MQGFTQQQIVGMHNYEKLLIELGEKSYVPSGSKWPVELRLLFVIIMNAGFFIVGKVVMRRTGANLLGMMNSVNTPPEIPKQKRRMKKEMQISFQHAIYLCIAFFFIFLNIFFTMGSNICATVLVVLNVIQLGSK